MDEINKLNAKYNFYKKNNIDINLAVDSTKKLYDYNINKKMNEIIDANDYDIKCQLQHILINREKYFLYSQELDRLINQIKKEKSNDIVSKIKLYFKLIIIKLKKHKVQLNFNVNVLISYTSPTGRNYYERRFNYNYDDLVILKSNMNHTQNHQLKKYEEKSKERNYIQCVYCNKLIDLNSTYCTHCGKKQAENNLNIYNEQNKNCDNSSVTNLYGYNAGNNKTFLPAFDDNFFLQKKSDNSSKVLLSGVSAENRDKKSDEVKKISNQTFEEPASIKVNNYKEQENERINNLFQIFSNTFDKYGIKFINRKCTIFDDCLKINYSIKLIDKSKLAKKYISVYVSIHENNDIISYIKEIECVTFDDFEDGIIEDYVKIPIKEINVEEISKILIYGKKDM